MFVSLLAFTDLLSRLFVTLSSHTWVSLDIDPLLDT
jgi:hypothetical protein